MIERCDNTEVIEVNCYAGLYQVWLSVHYTNPLNSLLYFVVPGCLAETVVSMKLQLKSPQTIQ